MWSHSPLLSVCTCQWTHKHKHAVSAHSNPCAGEILMTEGAHAHTRIHWSEIFVLIDII